MVDCGMSQTVTEASVPLMVSGASGLGGRRVTSRVVVEYKPANEHVTIHHLRTLASTVLDHVYNLARVVK